MLKELTRGSPSVSLAFLDSVFVFFSLCLVVVLVLFSSSRLEAKKRFGYCGGFLNSDITAPYIDSFYRKNVFFQRCPQPASYFAEWR